MFDPKDQLSTPIRMITVPSGLARKSCPITITMVPTTPIAIAAHSSARGLRPNTIPQIAASSGCS